MAGYDSKYKKSGDNNYNSGDLGVSSNINPNITKEENKEELLRLIATTEEGIREGKIPMDKGIAIIKDIRIRLNDKFEMERKDDAKRIIVVPQKHFYICPHTNRECSNMPTKEVCMRYYNLVEKNN